MQSRVDIDLQLMQLRHPIQIVFVRERDLLREALARELSGVVLARLASVR